MGPYDMGGCVFPIEELHKPEAIECGEELVVCEHPGEKDITEIKGGSSDKFGPHLQYMGGPPDKMGGPEKMLRLVSTSSSDKDSEDMSMVQMRGRERESEEEEVDDETDKKKKKKRKGKGRPAKIPDSWKRPLFRPPIIECPTEPYDMGGCVFPIEELHKPEALECGEELVVCEHPGEKDITEIKGGSSDKFGPHLQYMGGPPDKMGGPEKMLRLVSASSSDKDSEDMNEEEEVDDETDKKKKKKRKVK